LADAYRKGYFELPLYNHELKQLIGRANLIAAVMPELEFPAFNEPEIQICLAHAFLGLTLAKEAQGTPLREAFLEHIGKDRLSWMDELAPLIVAWPEGRRLKLQYAEQARDEDGQPNSPELQVKLQECFAVKEHPHVCEGRLPVKLWLCAPDGKRLEATVSWPAFKANGYPKIKAALQKKYPGVAWV
jgi:ATP-dependent helicase HrpB